MHRLLRNLRRLLVGLLIFAIAVLLTLSPGDKSLYPATDERIPVHVVDHGYHTGLIVRPSSLRRAALAVARDDQSAAKRLRWLAERYPGADWLEIGWGDAEFYQTTPGIGDVRFGLALEALFTPTDAALQIVPIRGAPVQAFSHSDLVTLDISPEGMAGLARRLAQTVPQPAPSVPLGPSLYGGGAFFAAELDYHLFRTCNHWIAWLLRGAGVPASKVPGTFSTTLMLELRWRAGKGI